MASKVTITIGGRAFTVACDDGQEARVANLGQYIDMKMREVARMPGVNNNEAYQWMLVSLMLADELSTAREKLDTTTMDTQHMTVKVQRQGEIDIEAVRHLTNRIEELAEKLSVSG